MGKGYLRILGFAVAGVIVFFLAIIVSWSLGSASGRQAAMQEVCASELMTLHLLVRQIERQEYDEAVNSMHRAMWAHLNCLDLYAGGAKAPARVRQTAEVTRTYLEEVSGDRDGRGAEDDRNTDD